MGKKMLILAALIPIGGHGVAAYSTPERRAGRLRKVRNAVVSMLEDHRRFIGILTEEQWTAAKDSITRLEQLRAVINTQLEGFDEELRMPAPESKVLIRYEGKANRALQEWQKQHRTIGTILGIKNR